MEVITREELVDLIDTTDYENRKGTGTTICYMRLKCGFDIIGTSSTHISQFNKPDGETYAFEDAIGKLHEFEEYRRRYQLHQDSLVAQANTELWNTRRYGRDEETAAVASIRDDEELYRLLGDAIKQPVQENTQPKKTTIQQAFEDALFADSQDWEPGVDEKGNYVPPKYGADERFARRVSMPITLLRLLGKI